MFLFRERVRECRSPFKNVVSCLDDFRSSTETDTDMKPRHEKKCTRALRRLLRQHSQQVYWRHVTCQWLPIRYCHVCHMKCLFHSCRWSSVALRGCRRSFLQDGGDTKQQFFDADSCNGKAPPLVTNGSRMAESLAYAVLTGILELAKEVSCVADIKELDWQSVSASEVTVCEGVLGVRALLTASSRSYQRRHVSQLRGAAPHEATGDSF